MEAHRKLTRNMREIRAVRGCLNKALLHYELRVLNRLLVNNPG